MISTCARLCAASYDDKAVGFITVGDLRYGVFGNIVCIRGTANAENWLRDAGAMPWRSCGGYLAHKGFIDAYRALCAGGMPTAKNADLIATGHSLGGAIATLLAEYTGCQLVTFGSPKVYFRFSPAPKLQHTRIVRDDDPVPLVPGLLYSHRCEPMVLKDSDRQLLQVEDHFISGYVKALANQGGLA